VAVASNLENGDAASNAQRCQPSDLPEAPLTEPESSNLSFSSSIPAPTPAQRMKASNIPQQEESHLGQSEDVSRRIPRPTSQVPHDRTDPIIPALTPNSNTSSSQPMSQTQSQLSRLSNHHAQAESTIDHENSQTLLRGIMVDLKARECPFFNLLQVREILERTHRHRYST
jgi:hypothetical protein